MYAVFTDHARNVMEIANREAQRFNHEYIGTEHLLLGLVADASGDVLRRPGGSQVAASEWGVYPSLSAAEILKNLNVAPAVIRQEIEKIVQSGPNPVTGKVPHTPRAKKVIEYAMEEAASLNRTHVGTEHLLLGLMRVRESVASEVLNNLGLRPDEVREEAAKNRIPA